MQKKEFESDRSLITDKSEPRIIRKERMVGQAVTPRSTKPLTARKHSHQRTISITDQKANRGTVTDRSVGSVTRYTKYTQDRPVTVIQKPQRPFKSQNRD